MENLGHFSVEINKLILARRHVAALRANPDLIIQAQAENDRQLASHRATIGNRVWRFLLRRSIDEIIAYMLQKSPTCRTLRSTSPFSMILPPEPEAERRRMWRAAKAELNIEMAVFSPLSAETGHEEHSACLTMDAFPCHGMIHGT